MTGDGAAAGARVSDAGWARCACTFGFGALTAADWDASFFALVGGWNACGSFGVAAVAFGATFSFWRSGFEPSLAACAVLAGCLPFGSCHAGLEFAGVLACVLVDRVTPEERHASTDWP
jgi:hypothetical protein